MLKFYDEMIIPSVNSIVYNQVYQIENWLRRICLAAYMTKYGDKWESEIPNYIIGKQKRIAEKDRDYFYLDIEDDENIIWMSTYGDLVKLLLSDKVIDNIFILTGFSNEIFEAKLNELGAVRNKLAHNRSFTETTLKITDGLFESFKGSIKRFKKQLLYSMGSIQLFESDDPVGIYYNNAMLSSPIQNFIAISDEYYHLVALPAIRQPYIHIGNLLGSFEDYLKYILAFLINKTGDEYSVLIPKVVDECISLRIVDRFFETIEEVRTDKAFTSQSPKFVCHPKIWFYENREPKEF